MACGGACSWPAAAISLAVAIWAMHFVGMLAARLPFPVDYLVFPTLLSFLVCVLVVGAGVYAASGARLRPARLAAAAVFMGGGIAIMHYIGMSALHASAHMEHDANVGDRQRGRGHRRLRAGAVAGGRTRRAAAAVPVGNRARLAIAGMHYTAMAGLTLMPFPATAAPEAPVLSTDLLAIVVAIVAFMVSGIFLLTLVPDRVAILPVQPTTLTDEAPSRRARG